MKKILSIILISTMLFFIASCGGNKLVGKWEGQGYLVDSIEFFSDGTYKSSDANYQGGYSVDGDRLRLSGYIAPDRTYTFKVSGNKLVLYSDDGDVTGEYKRQD